MDGLLAIAGTSFLVGLSGAMMPGPMLTVTITEVVKRGFKAGPLLAVGHCVVELLLLAALSLGLGAILHIGWVNTIITVIGGSALLWMALGMLKGVWKGTLSLNMTGSQVDSRMGPMFTGGIVSVANPTWIIWWATVGLTYVAWSSAAGGMGLTAFFCGHALADFGWMSLVALVVTSGRTWLNDGTYRILIGVCGLFLSGLGMTFILSGAQHWLN